MMLASIFLEKYINKKSPTTPPPPPTSYLIYYYQNSNQSKFLHKIKVCCLISKLN
jgi:hypothetical protein